MNANKVYLHSIATTVPKKFYTQKFALKYMKKIVADFSEAEKSQLFYGTAARIYRL